MKFGLFCIKTFIIYLPLNSFTAMIEFRNNQSPSPFWAEVWPWGEHPVTQLVIYVKPPQYTLYVHKYIDQTKYP